ncbi:hypothetical protein GCM10027416_09860 [Okibacterium endophyticum]
MSNDLHDLSTTDALARFRGGVIAIDELMTAAIERTEALKGMSAVVVGGGA